MAEIIHNIKKHFVLVHGAAGGAWVWYKVKPCLEAAGYRVTVLDMAASGQHPKSYKEVHTFKEYNEPLMEFMGSLKENEKVILVGHSLGGMNLAFAMETYPQNISVAIFLAAVLPDTLHQPSYVLEKYQEATPVDAALDSQISLVETINGPIAWVHFGPKDLASKFYNQSSIEDLELAKILSRPTSFFVPDLSEVKKFSDQKYGSTKRVYILCKDDIVVTEEFQRWVIKFSGIQDQDVIEMNGSDHMPMISTPLQLCQHMIEIADEFE